MATLGHNGRTAKSPITVVRWHCRPTAVTRVLQTNSANPFHAQILKETDSAAARMGINLLHLEARDPGQIETAFDKIADEHAQAVIIAPDPTFRQQERQLVGLAARNRLPSMFATRELVKAGGLISYGTNYVDHFPRAAYYVDR